MPIATLPISEDELPDAIRQLTDGQQAIIRALSEHPTWSISQLARHCGAGRSTVEAWLWSPGTWPLFQPCFRSVQRLSVDALPTMAVATAKAASMAAVQRDVEAACAPNGDTAAMVTAQGHRRDALYRIAGLVSDSQPGATVNLQQLLVQVSQEPAPLGGIWPPKNDDATHEPAGA